MRFGQSLLGQTGAARREDWGSGRYLVAGGPHPAHRLCSFRPAPRSYRDGSPGRCQASLRKVAPPTPDAGGPHFVNSPGLHGWGHCLFAHGSLHRSSSGRSTRRRRSRSRCWQHSRTTSEGVPIGSVHNDLAPNAPPLAQPAKPCRQAGLQHALRHKRRFAFSLQPAFHHHVRSALSRPDTKKAATAKSPAGLSIVQRGIWARLLPQFAALPKSIQNLMCPQNQLSIEANFVRLGRRCDDSRTPLGRRS